MNNIKNISKIYHLAIPTPEIPYRWRMDWLISGDTLLVVMTNNDKYVFPDMRTLQLQLPGFLEVS